MAKELNKHTPDSEELFKRLESKDTGDLDDFDKEALEGFDSLEDIGLAKELNAELNRKIDERFFEKEEKKGSSLRYLSIAAGLALIVGLSIFFINITSDKKELAVDGTVNSEKVANEVSAPADLTPEEAAPAAETVSKDDAKPEELNNAARSNTTAETPLGESDKKDQDEGELKPRMVLKEPRKDDWQSENTKTADAESGDDLKQQQDKNMGPPAPTSPVVAEDQKVTGKKEEKEKTELYKANDNRNESPANTISGNVSTKEAAKKPEAPKEKKRASGEALATEQKANAATDEVSVATTNTLKTAPNKRDEHHAEFESVSFSKPQDYIKTEIDKSEMLKENVKSFKAELTISEKGKVSAVKFLTNFENCKGCEKEMRRVLLNMPGWKVNQEGKSVKETISFIY